MQQLRRAALAPDNPSEQDRAVARQAAQAEQQARTQLAEKRRFQSISQNDEQPVVREPAPNRPPFEAVIGGSTPNDKGRAATGPSTNLKGLATASGNASTAPGGLAPGNRLTQRSTSSAAQPKRTVVANGSVRTAQTQRFTRLSETAPKIKPPTPPRALGATAAPALGTRLDISV